MSEKVDKSWISVSFGKVNIYLSSAFCRLGNCDTLAPEDMAVLFSEILH
jgi:hypothetical protein